MTTRREFTRFAGTGLAAPLILGAANKSGSSLPIIGEGSHKYEVHHDWGAVPASIKYGNTHGVVEDSQGLIYVHHTVNKASESSDSMVVFDKDGKFVRSFGAKFKTGAHGLHLNKEGKEEFLYLCDTRGTVSKMTLKGEEVWSLGFPEESDKYKAGADGKKPRYSPTNLTVAPNGDVYVGDGYGSSFINVYDKAGKFKFSFGGGKTAAKGDLNSPHGIWLDTRGKSPRLLVADRGNGRLQYFTLDGKHDGFNYTDAAGAAVTSIEEGKKPASLPCHFSQHKSGDIVIPDLGARVVVLDKTNAVVAVLGDDSKSDWRKTRVQTRDAFAPGKFVCPHGACFDRKGNIFVVEWVEIGRVTKLRKIA